MCLANHKNVFDESSEVPDHLKPLIENASENLTESERGELKNLIVEFGDNFLKVRLVKHILYYMRYIRGRKT